MNVTAAIHWIFDILLLGSLATCVWIIWGKVGLGCFLSFSIFAQIPVEFDDKSQENYAEYCPKCASERNTTVFVILPINYVFRSGRAIGIHIAKNR